MEDAAEGRFALASGWIPLAIQCFKDALAKAGLSGEARDELNIDLATAYLADANVAGATAALKAVERTSTPGYLLRDALIQERANQWDNATAQLARVTGQMAELPKADHPWYYLAQATLAEHEQKAGEANVAWTMAIAEAATPLQAAQFQAAQWKGQIFLGLPATPEVRDQLQKQLNDSAQDPVTNAQYALELAIVLDQLGQPADALKLIGDNLRRVDLDRHSLNNLRLAYVLIDQEHPDPQAAARGTIGTDQETLQTILKDWPEKDAPDFDALVQTQKTALALLENGKLVLNPKDLKNLVDGLIQDPRGHPLIKQLYLLQMQLAESLSQNAAAAATAQHLAGDAADAARYLAEAGDAATHLLQLPKDQTVARDTAREGAWLTLALVAWNASPRQYLEAAKNLNKLRDALPESEPDRKLITARLADLYFLNGEQTGDPENFRNAAKFYGTLIEDPPPEENLGSLLERAVESDIKAGQLDDAGSRLDKVASQLADADERWRAEFNLLLALRDDHQVAKAFARLNHLFELARIDSLQIDLRLRLRWLDAALAVDAADPSAADKAQVLQEEADVETKAAAVAGNKELEASRRELAASGLLLKYRAAAQSGKTADKEKSFVELKENYPFTDAEVNALYLHAIELRNQNKLIDAANAMKDLADMFIKNPANRQNPGARFAPFALYDAALYLRAADGSGRYDDALDCLKKFVDTYPDHPLINDVRFEQGELMSLRNQFDLAFDIFDDLRRKLETQNRPWENELWANTLIDRVNCMTGIAMQHNNDPQWAKPVRDELFRLWSLDYLPVWARVQAGYSYAQGLPPDDADKPKAYGRVIAILDNPKLLAELDKHFNGRLFLARSFSDLGDYYSTRKDYDSARKVYQSAMANNLSVKYFQHQLDLLPTPSAASAPAATSGSTMPTPPPTSTPAPADGTATGS